MDDQNTAAPNQNPPTGGAPSDQMPPVPSVENVPPPPIPDTPMDAPQPTIPPADTTDSGSSAPSFDTPNASQDQANLEVPPVIGGVPPKKRSGKKVIATILGLFVLIGGLGAGVILVRQQQDIRERAAQESDTGGGGTACAPGRTSCSGVCVDLKTSSNNCGSCGNKCSTGRVCTNGQCVLDTKNLEEGPGDLQPAMPPPPTCQTGQTLCGSACRDTRYDSNNCGSCGVKCPTGQKCWESVCVTTTTTQECPVGYITGGSNRDAAEEACEGVCGVRETPTANRICENGTIVNAGTATIPNWCYKCTGTTTTDTTTPSQPTSPPSGGVTAQCLNIKAYDTEWEPITDLSSLRAGDVVRFAVAGSASSGSFSKARFKVNGVTRPEVTDKKPGTQEFYDEYTIPEGITTFTINAELFHSSLGWF